jgi:hypothetical protein
MKCKERSGFLFAHPCEYAAAARCSHCGKPVCGRHVRDHEGQKLCISCHKNTAPPPADPAVARATDGRAGHYTYYDDPYWYSYYHYRSYSYYDASDHGAFEAAGTESETWAEEDWDAS